MILIVSSKNDGSTNQVTEWLDFYKAKWMRINLTQLGLNINFTCNLAHTRKMKHVRLNSSKISLSEIKAIWLRRYNYSTFLFFPRQMDINNMYQIKNNIDLEQESAWKLLCNELSDAKRWLNHHESISLSKIRQLEIAKSLNLKFPPTIVTTTKNELLKFKKTHSKIIIKPIETYGSHIINGISYTPLTKLIDEDFISNLEDTFFPVLCQKYIPKEYEIRTFYLNKKFYSSAIFSQRNENTIIDSRNFDDANSTRIVPYKLDSKMELNLVKFMDKANLNSGSLDFIKSGKSTYFLEVNPVGQFGMYSYVCNFKLEKKIAEHLIKIANEK
jgi:ATP-GRASP peptide maturase of grasp-with-spasm system